MNRFYEGQWLVLAQGWVEGYQALEKLKDFLKVNKSQTSHSTLLSFSTP